jgi:hypothetical protein
MLNKMKSSLSGLSALVSIYFPEQMKETLLQMATEIDRLRAEIDVLKNNQVK